MPKTTEELFEKYELPDCPKELIKEMIKNKIPCDGTICIKCKWNKKICNKLWFSEEEYSKLEAENKQLKTEWNKILNASINFHNTIISNLREENKQILLQNIALSKQLELTQKDYNELIQQNMDLEKANLKTIGELTQANTRIKELEAQLSLSIKPKCKVAGK